MEPSTLVTILGAGYSVAVWGWLPKADRLVVIGEFSLFHETDVPDTYSPSLP